MIPELGQFALSLALAVALVQAVFPLAGAHNGNLAWMASRARRRRPRRCSSPSPSAA